MKNWKTTVFGVASIIFGIGNIIYGNVEAGIASIVTGCGLLLAKDFNETGTGK